MPRIAFTAASALLVLLLAGLPTSAALAQEHSAEALAGELQIVHLWSRDPEQFLEAWRGPTPPNLQTSTRTERNMPIQQFIILANCQADEDGNCRLSATVDITAPDGTAYGDQMEFPVWDNQPAPPRNRLVLSPNSIGLVIEDGEQLGMYQVALAVTDHHAGVTAKNTATLEVIEAGELDAAEAVADSG